MHQFMHLYNTDGTATDNFVVYLPASEKLKPQTSDIISLGYHTKPGKRTRFSSEAYYKILSNQPIFYAADLFDRDDMEANSLVGDGAVIGLKIASSMLETIQFFGQVRHCQMPPENTPSSIGESHFRLTTTDGYW